jgi:hypothetical protein
LILHSGRYARPVVIEGSTNGVRVIQRGSVQEADYRRVTVDMYAENIMVIHFKEAELIPELPVPPQPAVCFSPKVFRA